MNTLQNIKAPLALITFIFSALILAESSQANSTQHEGYSDLMVRSTWTDEFSGRTTEWLVSSAVAPVGGVKFPYNDMVTRLRFYYRPSYTDVMVEVWANTGYFNGKLNCYGGTCTEHATIQVKIDDAQPAYADIDIRENNETFKFKTTAREHGGFFGKVEIVEPIVDDLLASENEQMTVMMRVPFSVGETVTLKHVVDVEAFKRFHAEYEAARADYKAKR